VPGLFGAHQIHRAVGDDAIEPGAEIRARFEPSELPVGAKKALLHDILCILFIAGHPERQSKDGPAVALDERPKRLAVALARTVQVAAAR
jgi:hypothetical protein